MVMFFFSAFRCITRSMEDNRYVNELIAKKLASLKWGRMTVGSLLATSQVYEVCVTSHAHGNYFLSKDCLAPERRRRSPFQVSL